MTETTKDRIVHDDHPFQQGTRIKVMKRSDRDTKGESLGGDLSGCEGIVTSANAMYRGDDGEERVSFHAAGGPLFSVPASRLKRLSGRQSFSLSGRVGAALARIFKKRRKPQVVGACRMDEVKDDAPFFQP